MKKHEKGSFGKLTGLTISVRNNNMGQALKKFKKRCKLEGLFQDMDRIRFFEKPSLKRKRMKAIARKRHLKELREQKEELGF